ncbi:MAG: 50S ribosomal protein L5 [Sedimentisphaerales bacterium]
MARLKDLYKSKIGPALQEKYSYKSIMAVPRIQKIVVSMGVGKAVQDKKFIETAQQDLMMITGQKPLVIGAKKSVSNFKVRQGDKTGLKVTLRGQRMYEFMDRLINLAIPRVKDFRGLNPNSFDEKGNYSFGMSEQTVFPEIDSAKVENTQGMNITFVTTAKTANESKDLLKMFGMPFRE